MNEALANPPFGAATLSNCERELIHLAGSIQPHGVLLTLSEPQLLIVQASRNLGCLLGQQPLEDWLQQPVERLGGNLASGLAELRTSDLAEPTPLRCVIAVPSLPPATCGSGSVGGTVLGALIIQSIDSGLLLFFPAPHSFTGEDVLELQAHGGRVVLQLLLARCIEAASTLDPASSLPVLPGLRLAMPGEFTERAYLNDKLDLAQAEAVSDLIDASTEAAARSASRSLSGGFSAEILELDARLMRLRMLVEATLDFPEEEIDFLQQADAQGQLSAISEKLHGIEVRTRQGALLRDGITVVIAGQPNVGKSSLLNALAGAELAIVTPIAGTTRDVLTRPVAYAGVPFLFADTAGLHDGTDDVVEAIGIERAMEALDRADLVLWLGPEGAGPPGAWEIAGQIDKEGYLVKVSPRHRISARTGEGIEALRSDLVETASQALPRPGEAALNERQHELLCDARTALAQAAEHNDPLLIAEALRLARVAFDSLLGQTATEDMLDTLFGRFCIGK